MRIAWTLGLAAALQFAALAWFLRSLDPSVLALQWTFTAQGFADVLAHWSPAERARFLAHLPWDMALAASYAAFGLRLTARAGVFHAVGPAARALARVALPLAALCDVLENLLHGHLMQAAGAAPAWLYALAGGAAALKWAGLAGFALVTAGALVARGRCAARHRH